MAKTLSNSEFAQILAARFPALSKYDHDVNVYDKDGCYAIHAQETKTGYSSVIVNNKPYGKMNAEEKRNAVEWALNLPVEIVSEKDSILGIDKNYYVAGAWLWHLENKDRGNFWYESKKADLISIEKYI